MQVNSSTIVQMSPPICSPNSSFFPVLFSCFNEEPSSILITTLTFTNFLLSFPVCVLIFWLGFRQWRNSCSAPEPTSHTDVFTNCMAAVDNSYTLGLLSYYYAVQVCHATLMTFVYYCFLYANCGQTFLHFLTCIERYLAVVHPITYMRLKNAQGVRVRNAAIACVFLLSFGMVGFGALLFPVFPTKLLLFALAFVVVIVCFCTVAVFCVLRRPGLGNDESKRRAFHTVAAITMALLLRFFGQCFSIIQLGLEEDYELNYCMTYFAGCWLCVPSGLVLPVLFLQRKGLMSFNMAVNSSLNAFLASAALCTDNFSLYPVIFRCSDEHRTSVILTTPLSAHQQPATHTDVFTYCMAAVDIGCMSGLVLYFLNLYVCKLMITLFAYYNLIFSFTAQTIFHVLTCVERYLAVVHPITYMRLKKAQWVRIRNVGIAGVFLVSFAMVGFGVQMFPMFPGDVMFCTMALVVVIVCYCTAAVFCVLRRPGLGSDESKRRAFHTVTAITAVMLIRLGGQYFSVTLLSSGENGELDYCVGFLSGYWLCLPSNLVLPVLFLQKRGILNQFSCRNLS
ncbi:hypothetical protein FQA47_023465 [Oryzias melastigma]|uniref:G-protein coupled receptors family 1 profile domain-containing protein n=1 Tax=Oryzias melastigma TaxID=30732 RepID=A0A834BJC8_ORYME|nr:hypothetical protein FQA47_023465 [Oryzias melastigma]